MTRKQARRIRVLGLDPGDRYTAWSVIRVRTPKSLRGVVDWAEVLEDPDLWTHESCGFIYPPDIGGTADFGESLSLWTQMMTTFISELRPTMVAAERYVHTPGGGSISERVNLRLGALAAQYPVSLVRNTDWKGWFKRNVDDYEPLCRQRFLTSTQHEADASGIALYAGCVLLRRAWVGHK